MGLQLYFRPAFVIGTVFWDLRKINWFAIKSLFNPTFLQACPSLYNEDDAVSSKAHEMIIGAKTEPNLTERAKTVAQVFMD